MTELTAHCDLRTGKIHGCRKGSFKWYHEKGHIAFNNNPKLSFISLLRGYFSDLWMLIIMFAVMRVPYTIYLSIFLYVIYMGIFFYEEWWCNQYAYKKLKGIKDS